MNFFRHFVLLVLLVLFSCFQTRLFAQSGDPLPTANAGSCVVTGTLPSNGTNEVQAFTISGVAASTVSFTLLGKSATLTLTGTEANADVSSKTQTAFNSLATVGSGGTSVATTGTAARVVSVTFQGNLAKLNIPQAVAVITSGTITVTGTTSTPGVTADGRREPKGRFLLSLSGTGGGPAEYINSSSTPLNPVWTLIGPAGQ